MKQKLLLIILILMALLFGWHMSSFWQNRIIKYEDQKFIIESGEYGYDLLNPDSDITLPDYLIEISGLSLYNDDEIVCVEDERGVIYFLNVDLKTIVRQEKFGAPGDYEGVEVLADTAYVAKSNGTIEYFKVNNKSGIGPVREIDTDLKSRNNLEGLGYLPSQKLLLLACKNKGDTKKFDTDHKSIFAVKTVSKAFLDQPAITIDMSQLNEKLIHNGLSGEIHLPFNPSGVAVHPFDGKIFIISYSAKLLIVMDEHSYIFQTIPLDPKLFEQPEGICFGNNGTLYIANEGKSGSGYILEFKNFLNSN